MDALKKRRGLGAIPDGLLRQLEACIRRQHLTGQTNLELARQFGVHSNTVLNYRRRLKKLGVLETARGSASRPMDQQGPLDAEDAGVEDFAQRLPSIGALTAQDRLRVLSYLATNAADGVKVQALKALDDLERAEAAAASIELGVPQTYEERLERLCELREAVGAQLWEAADNRVRGTSVHPAPPAAALT